MRDRKDLWSVTMKLRQVIPILFGFISIFLCSTGCSEYAGRGGSTTTESGEIPEALHIMNAGEFDAEVMNHKGYVLVDFSAHWCPPCRTLAPLINKLAVELKEKIKVVKVVQDDKGAENDEAFKEYVGAGGPIPTLVIFNSGKVVETRVGGLSYKDLKKWVEDNI